MLLSRTPKIVGMLAPKTWTFGSFYLVIPRLRITMNVKKYYLHFVWILIYNEVLNDEY